MASRAPKGWRTIAVGGATYLFTITSPGPRHHRTVRLTVRPSEIGPRGVLRGRGRALPVTTGITPSHWSCPCTPLSAATPITPRHVAEIIRQAAAAGWPTGDVAFHLSGKALHETGAVELVRR